jgi:8-oxo-dGTP pyrophosphatase MutT (NUDIX family)
MRCENGRDIRDRILRLFDTYLARHPGEAETVACIRSFVHAHPDCFRRQLPEGHITGSAWILDRTRCRVLLTHHRKLDIWVQLGGHADGDSDVAAVALREAREESGLKRLRLLSPDIFDIDIHTIPARRDEPEHLHYDCRFLLEAADEAYVVSDESHDLAWIDLGAITDYTTEASILRMIAKTRARQDR